MVNCAVLACVENMCRMVRDLDEAFGGKVVVLLGDFQQMCPVIRCRTRVQVADASIKAFHLWPLFSM
jgi:hypothetical protein